MHVLCIEIGFTMANSSYSSAEYNYQNAFWNFVMLIGAIVYLLWEYNVCIKMKKKKTQKNTKYSGSYIQLM